ncbi:hypothetical protein T484DRAFT_1880805, partial [Baffinella frigidus]
MAALPFRSEHVLGASPPRGAGEHARGGGREAGTGESGGGGKALTSHITCFLSRITEDPAAVTLRQIKEACAPHFGAEWEEVLGAHTHFFKDEATRLLGVLQAGGALNDGRKNAPEDQEE